MVVFSGQKESPLHFVLVHGFGGGGWCWYKIKRLMEALGFRVSTIDLKASGLEPSNADAVRTFDDYNSPLIDFLSSLSERDQVVLVGHSAGGLSVTQACHLFPSKITLAVYLAATMLRLGFHAEEDVKDGVPDLSSVGEVYEFGYGMGKENAPTSAIVKEEYLRQILYQMCSDEDCSLASKLLRPGPIMAFPNAKFEENGGSEVPRVYIKAARDMMLSPAQQDAMAKRWPPSQMYVMDSDHSPFFSTPVLLFETLIKAAESAGLARVPDPALEVNDNSPCSQSSTNF